MVWKWIRQRFGPQPPSVAQARAALDRHRPTLEQEFFRQAGSSGKPRGLRWKQIEWEPHSEMIRDRQTGQLLALVGITIAFEAIEGGDMEGVEAVGNLRSASAVFFHHRGDWRTIGKVIFNLGPREVLARFAEQYERAIETA